MRPWSSCISTSHTQVVCPACLQTAVAWIVPLSIGRRKLVWLDMPTANFPRENTTATVAVEARLSAIDA